VIDCDGDGRGFYFHTGEASSAIVQGFTIRDGYGTSGGGISIVASSPTIMNCVIDNCSAGDGGGIYINNASADPGIFNCVVSNCTAYGDGGGIRVHYCNGQIRNCTIVSNTCTGGAGGISSLGGDADIVNCIIYWNMDTQLDGAFYGLFSYNLVQGWTGGGTSFDGSPDFVPGTGGSYYLDASTSDAVDAGSVLATAACYPSADGSVCMSGGWTTKTNQQEDLGQVDVGYHYPHYAANIDVPSYKPTIQAAIDAAWNGDIVRVADGTYTGDGNRDLDTKGKRVTVQSLSGNASVCIIDCQGSSGSPHRGFYVRKGEGPQTVIKNMKIINGWGSYGGAINISGCSPSIQGCILSGNHATVDGGGIMNSQGNPAVTGCTFLNNTADDAGGGMLNHTCSPVLTSCIFQSNSGYYGGGGVYNYHASPTLNSCTFKYNSSSNGGGGGLHNDGSVSLPVLNGCVFQENEAVNGAGMYDRNGAHPTLADCSFLVNTTLSGGRGGAIYGTGSSLNLLRCRFSANEAYVDGGAVYRTGISNSTIDSCIFDTNVTASGGGAIYHYNQVNFMMTNSTFYRNESPNGGALWMWLNCTAQVDNCIFWDNRATTAGSQIGINSTCTLWMSCNDVEYGQSGIYVGGGSSLN
jgi:parallel beta-helix repeat protein